MKDYIGYHGLKEKLASKKGITLVEADRQVRDVVECIRESLLDDSIEGIQFVDFLTLEKVYRKPRKGRNPKQPEVSVDIPGKKSIKAKVGKHFSEELNK